MKATSNGVHASSSSHADSNGCSQPSLAHIRHEELRADLGAHPPTPTYAADHAALHEAAEVLKGGGVVAMPTETVYGLAGNALDSAAVSA